MPSLAVCKHKIKSNSHGWDCSMGKKSFKTNTANGSECLAPCGSTKWPQSYAIINVLNNYSTAVVYLILLTIHQQMQFCTEMSYPSLICCSTRVVTIVQSVVKRIHLQDCAIVTECVATRRMECRVSFLPCNCGDISRSPICDITCQFHRVSFIWCPGFCVSHFCTRRVWNKNRTTILCTATKC